jgi:hypothetical protein
MIVKGLKKEIKVSKKPVVVGKALLPVVGGDFVSLALDEDSVVIVRVLAQEIVVVTANGKKEEFSVVVRKHLKRNKVPSSACIEVIVFSSRKVTASVLRTKACFCTSNMTSNGANQNPKSQQSLFMQR